MEWLSLGEVPVIALHLRGVGRGHSHQSNEELLSEKNGKITGPRIIKFKNSPCHLDFLCVINLKE